MNIGILANPLTDNSSGKFLGKFCRVLGSVASKVVVINDGGAEISGVSTRVVCATSSLRDFPSGRRGLARSLYIFGLGQVQLTLGLARSARQIDCLVVFPVTMLLPVATARLLRIPIILYEAQDITGETPSGGLLSKVRFLAMRFLRDSVLRLSDVIVVESATVIKRNGIERYLTRIRICPLFVDTSRYRVVTPIGERTRKVGFIGTFDERKGVLPFALAAKQLSSTESNMRFIIVGDGPLRPLIQQELQGEIEQRVVELIQKVPEECFPEFMNQLALYVLPSKAEGLPNAILEAMACGTPVLASTAGGITDVVTDGRTGFIITGSTAEELAKDIERALDFKDIGRVTQEARDLILRRFSYEAAVKRYQDLMSSVPKRSGRMGVSLS